MTDKLKLKSCETVSIPKFDKRTVHIALNKYKFILDLDYKNNTLSLWQKCDDNTGLLYKFNESEG